MPARDDIAIGFGIDHGHDHGRQLRDSSDRSVELRSSVIREKIGLTPGLHHAQFVTWNQPPQILADQWSWARCWRGLVRFWTGELLRWNAYARSRRAAGQGA
jgi:hypothetical protein